MGKIIQNNISEIRPGNKATMGHVRPTFETIFGAFGGFAQSAAKPAGIILVYRARHLGLIRGIYSRQCLQGDCHISCHTREASKWLTSTQQECGRDDKNC